jgi:aspartyl-tRNA(Asn)/glutamyl-tRNA(Gln) amidotransferase subunit B
MGELRGWLISLGEQEGTDDEVWDVNKAKLAKNVCNWLINKLLALMNKDGKDISTSKTVTPENFAEFITLIHQNKINSTIAQQVLEKMYQAGRDPSVILQEDDLSGGADSGELEKIIDGIIATNADQVAQYKAGKTTLLQFFIGQAMRATKGKADPDQLKEVLIRKLQ